MLRPALVLFPMLISAAQAQEALETSPWEIMTGTDAGAVGTCIFEGGEIAGCYLVRCTGGHLQFVIRDIALSGFGVRSFSWQAGTASGHFPIERKGDDLGIVDLAKAPDLEAALRSDASEVQLATDDADNSYSTVFELTGAKTAIQGIAASCH